MLKKPLLEWWEPGEIVRARRKHSTSAAAVIAQALALGVLGAVLLTYALTKAPEQDAAMSFFVGEILAAGGVWMLIMLARRRAPRRLGLYARQAGRKRAPRDLPGAAAIVRHPLCPSYRALLVINRDGGKRFTGIPSDVSDESIRRVWALSEWGDLPLQSGDRALPKPWKEAMPGGWFFRKLEPWPDPETGVSLRGSGKRRAPDEEKDSVPGWTLFQWPSPPRYWPGLFEWRGRWAQTLFYFLFTWPLTMAVARISCDAFLKPAHEMPMLQYMWAALVLIGVSVPCAVVVWAAGSFFGWDDNVVRLAENELLFFGFVRRKAYFRWESVKEVAIHLSPYNDKAEEIEVVYDYYGIEATFAMKLRSKRIEDEKLAKALAEKMGSEQEVTQGPDGVTIRVRRFVAEEKGVKGGGTRESDGVQKASD